MSAISLREAALKYGIPARTISRWVEAGLIRVEQPAERRGLPMLVAEEDVAKARELYVPGKGGRGKVERMREAMSK